jgi:hypothetical protein
MPGMAGDDLTIVLFLIGLAATFAVAGMSQAGWKHWAFISILFLCAAILLVAGITWPWLKDVSPEAQRIISRIARSPIAWFVVIILGLSSLLVINKTTKQSGTDNRPRKVKTGLTLEFVPGQMMPLASNVQNIWRWYSLKQAMMAVHDDGTRTEYSLFTIFIIFDKPVAAKQILITGRGVTLPAHEAKDWGPRHAVIVFSEEPAGSTVQIRIVT